MLEIDIEKLREDLIDLYGFISEEEKELMVLTESIPTYEEKSYGAGITYEYISILSEEEANEAFSVTGVGGLWSGLSWDENINDHEITFCRILQDQDG